jgi:thioredoxin 1
MNDAQSHLPPSTGSASQSERGKFNWWRWFWIATLVVSLGWAWYDFYVPGNDIAWADDYTSAQQQAAQSGKPILLLFSAKWCVPCRIMKRNIWADELVKASVNGKFIPVTIDVDDPNAAAALSRYRVGATPTTVITDPQGTVLQQVQGGIGKTDFLALLGKLNPSTTPADGTGK